MSDPGRRLRILLVDDEPDILLLLQAMLRSPEWEVVGKARDGEEAVRIGTEIRPDVVVVDYMMPGLTGADVAAELKASNPDCHVLLVSAFHEAEEEARGNPHIDGFLDKGQIQKLPDLLKSLASDLGQTS